jgi:RimJ/RimL family protein N-acetyltransferase
MPAVIDAFIRRADRDDLDTIVEWMEDPDFQRFLYGDPARSPKQIREQIVGMLGRVSNQNLPNGIYLIIDSPKGPIGLLSLQQISWRNRTCSIDIYLGRKEMRAGVMAAIAFLRAMEYAFDELNLHRVSAYIYSFNKASWRIMEHSGAQREMVLKDHVSRDGELHDMYCYGFLRPDYEKMRARYTEKYPEASLAKMVEKVQQQAETEESAETPE